MTRMTNWTAALCGSLCGLAIAVSATGATVDEARALAQRVDVSATVDRVAAEGPRNLGRRENWHVSYRIAVPNRTSLSLTSSNGGIEISGLDQITQHLVAHRFGRPHGHHPRACR